MSDLVALVSTVVLWIVFFAMSTGIGALLAYDRVPRRPRYLVMVGRPPRRGATRIWSLVVAIVLLVSSQFAAISAIAQNLGSATPSELAILFFEPLLSLAWAIYLVRAMAAPS